MLVETFMCLQTLARRIKEKNTSSVNKHQQKNELKR